MVESTSPRTPSGAEKALIVALLLYAVAVVGPDTFRPLFHEGTTRAMRWYPIATVGFEADNNGKVISVEEDGPADRAGLKPDDQIDLGSVQPDRRAINKFVYVAHGTPIEMVVQRGANQRVQVAIKPENERLGGWDAASLLMAQASALFFIALCAYLIWHRATWSTWGFFLYGMWFNSGQYFVWYANLPVAGLVVFDLLQAAAQALALTGFLAFAMFFPDEQTPGWRSSHRLALLVGVFAVLLVSGLLSFCNFFFGWRTEAMYRVYYAFTWVAYLLYQGKYNASRRKDVEQYTTRKRWQAEIAFRKKVFGLRFGEVMWQHFYHRINRKLGGITHELAPQPELDRLAAPYYNRYARGGEGHLEVAKNIYYSNKDLCHMVLSVKPFGCMPSTQSDGAQAAVVSQYRDMIFLPIETSGEGEINAHSRVQMALGEAKNKAKREFQEVLDRKGLTLEECRAYVDAHPEMKRPMYRVPHTKGVVGTAANFVFHIAERMGRA